MRREGDKIEQVLSASSPDVLKETEEWVNKKGTAGQSDTERQIKD
jgi:hypothetical protein